MTYQDMQAYVSLKLRLNLSQIQRFVRYVEDLDDVYIEDYHKKQSAKGVEAGSQAPSSAHSAGS